MRPEDREKIGRGGGVIMSGRTALQTILADLRRRGFKVGTACDVAADFAHLGDHAGQSGAKHDRAPGCLFPEGITLLVTDRQHPERSKLRSLDPDTPLHAMRMSLDAVDLEILFSMRFGGLGIDVHTAMFEIRGTA